MCTTTPIIFLNMSLHRFAWKLVVVSKANVQFVVSCLLADDLICVAIRSGRGGWWCLLLSCHVFETGCVLR